MPPNASAPCSRSSKPFPYKSSKPSYTPAAGTPTPATPDHEKHQPPRTLVGLDVHATKIVAAVLDAETGQLQTFSMGGDTAGAARFCAGLPRPVRVAYEAGPTGYGLARELATHGVECVVAAPSKIPRAPGDRVKTDRRDAELLVRLLMAGKLHPVRVPGDEEEALRDQARAREAVRVDLMRCRHRLSKLLLRHGIRFDDGDAWTARHRQWLA